MSPTSAISYIIVAFSVVYAFTLPAFRDLSLLLDEKAAFAGMVAKASEIEERKNTLLAEFNKISASDIKKIETLIPTSLNFVKLVADIDSVASRHGISIRQISSADNSASAGSIEEAENNNGYKSATIGFEFMASYEDFNNFMNDLERSLRILDIKSVKVSSGDKGIYKYEVSLDTYWSG